MTQEGHDEIFRGIEFINKFSSNDIKPFPITKLLTYQDYIDKYKDRHLKISSFYGDMTVEEYKKNIKKMGILIDFKGKKKELTFYPFQLNKINALLKTKELLLTL